MYAYNPNMHACGIIPFKCEGLGLQMMIQWIDCYIKTYSTKYVSKT